MITLEQKDAGNGGQMMADGGGRDAVFSSLGPDRGQGISGAGFVMVGYKPPAREPAYRLISSQSATGE